MPPQTADQLTLEEAVGQVVWAGIGDDLATVEEMARQGQIGAVLVGRGELVTPRQAAELANHLQQLAPLPLLFAADFEAGVGQQLQEGATELPTHMAIGASASRAIARTCGQITAREARAIGVQVVLAPVLDVNSNPHNPIINVRSFGADPELVGEMGKAFAQGVANGNALAVGKHFPGHGDTSEDSHLRLPHVRRGRRELEEIDLAPYRPAIADGLPAIMTAHVCYPALDPTPGLPATLSYLILTDLLRHQMGFTGLIVTDAMAMRAVADNFPPAEADVMAMRAGSDLVLAAHPRETYHALLGAARANQLAPQAVHQAAARILAVKQRLGLMDRRTVAADEAEEALGTPEHVTLAREAAEAAITIVRNEGVLPLRPTGDDWVAVVCASEPEGPTARACEVLTAEMRQRWPQTAVVELPVHAADALAREVVRACREAAMVVFAAFPSVSADDPAGPEISRTQAAVLGELQAGRSDLALVSYGSPYLVRQFPHVPAYVCAYGATRPLVEAGVAALFGELVPAGKLPIPIPEVAAMGSGLRY
ncbi:MAG: glycoside hydrolase family 3 protein [Armatimonadota bacterium]